VLYVDEKGQIVGQGEDAFTVSHAHISASAAALSIHETEPASLTFMLLFCRLLPVSRVAFRLSPSAC
jgi:hypothetical protein